MGDGTFPELVFAVQIRLLIHIYSYLQFIGILIFVVAVIFGAHAGWIRDKNKRSQNAALSEKSSEKGPAELKHGYLLLGVFFSVLAGIGSAALGLAYVYANPCVVTHHYHLSLLGANAISWEIVFFGAWVPYMLYFLVRNIKHKTLFDIRKKGTMHYWFFLLLMGIGYWGCIMLFSQAAIRIGGILAPTIAWPIWMIFIILCSNLWSFALGEWKGSGRRAIKEIVVSALLLSIAILIFAGSAEVKPF